MRVITERDLIRGVADRWHDQYASDIAKNVRDLKKVHLALLALDLENCSAADVANVIGNNSWTMLNCDECGEFDKKRVIELGEEPDYESHTARICDTCFEEAIQLMNNKKAP